MRNCRRTRSTFIRIRAGRILRAFSSKVVPVCVAKMRPDKEIEPRSDAIGTEMAPGAAVDHLDIAANDILRFAVSRDGPVAEEYGPIVFRDEVKIMRDGDDGLFERVHDRG